MPFLLLLLLTPACLQEFWPQPGPWVASPAWAALYTWTGVTAAVAVAALVSGRLHRRLAGDPGRREDLLSSYGRWRFYQLLCLFAAYGGGVYLLGWGWVVQSLLAPDINDHPMPLPPGGELLILAPFLVGLLFSWAFFYDAERAFHDTSPTAGDSPYWGRWEYLAYQARNNLALVFVPIALLVIQKALIWCVPTSSTAWWAPATTFLGILPAVAAFICMPWILRLVLGLRSMPPVPLRDRLLATSRRLRFRCSGVLLWNTRGGVANAMVVGIVPFLRYVVMTDRLMSDLTPDEVEAVFGHEVGHVKHRHMLYYMGFLMASMVVLWALTRPYLDVLPALNTRGDLAVLLLVACLGTYIFVVFGFLSRRCERQADIYGCRAVSCAQHGCTGHEPGTLLASGDSLCPTGIRTFINALEKVATVNGISRDRPGWLQSWQHSTIARRVDFLQRMLADPSLEPRFQFRVAMVKWGLLLSLAALLLVMGSLGWEIWAR
jgi:Zn-dependent protease with chaperone function